MSRVLVIGSDSPLSREIGSALSGSGFPMEYSAGHADTLQKLRMRSFGVVRHSATKHASFVIARFVSTVG